MPLGANFWTAVGVILTLAFGIPPILDFFTSDRTTIGILALAIVGLVIAGIFSARWYLTLPDYTLTDVTKSLVLNDKEGRSATQISNMTARANGPGLRHFNFRMYGADGTIENYRINGEKPSGEESWSGGTEIYKEFSVPLKHFQKRDIKVSFDCTDTFRSQDEDWTHTVSYQTKKMALTIQFPADRPCIDASASLRYGGHPHGPLPGLVKSENGRELTLKVKKPGLGAQYTIEWRW